MGAVDVFIFGDGLIVLVGVIVERKSEAFGGKK
jgi:hypothetical protein